MLRRAREESDGGHHHTALQESPERMGQVHAEPVVEEEEVQAEAPRRAEFTVCNTVCSVHQGVGRPSPLPPKKTALDAREGQDEVGEGTCDAHTEERSHHGVSTHCKSDCNDALLPLGNVRFSGLAESRAEVGKKEERITKGQAIGAANFS